MKKEKKALPENEDRIAEMIRKYNDLEKKLADLIYHYYSPSKNEISFRQILLNGVVLGMADKLKVLANISEFYDKKTWENIRAVMRIRNAIVHNNCYFKGVDYELESNGDFAITVAEHLNVLNSEGKLKIKDFDEEYKNFIDAFNKIQKHIESNINKFK